MRDATTALVVVGALAAWYFVVAYQVMTRGAWMRNPLGRHMMQFTANLGALLTLIGLTRLWPTYPGRQWITTGLFAVMVVQLVWRCVLLHRTQHTAPKERV